MDSAAARKIMIVGLPNSGKSQVFNNLTGEYTVVANSPLTTIQLKRTRCRIGNQICEIIDTPGLHGLYVHSEEELVVRDAIFSDRPDVIIQCMDANRLKQSLTLAADLLTLSLPMIISLNALDETSRKGIWIDSEGLSRLLGVPVVESMAIYGQGTRELKGLLEKARRAMVKVRYGDVIDDGLLTMGAELRDDFPYNYTASLLMLRKDPFIMGQLAKTCGDLKVKSIQKEADEIRGRFRGNINRFIIGKRNRWIDDVTEKVIKKQKIAPREFSQRVAGLSRHPVYGLPILLMVIYAMFYLVVNVANVLSEWMTAMLWTPVETLITRVFPSGFWHELCIGEYGVLSLGLANALLTVLPILGVFFLLFNTLEDIGYIPNLSVMTNRLLNKLGLSGNAILPLVLGFGCKTMAVLTTRTLRSKRERNIVVFLIAFSIPCAAQLGLNMSILGMMGAGSFIIAFSVLAFIGVAAGMGLNMILKGEEKIPFIQELPAIRFPRPMPVLKKTYYRLYWFLKESLLVFVYAALALFTADRLGILDAVKRGLSPVIEGVLGLPLAMTDAIILCFARREAGAGFMINLVRNGEMDYIQSIVAVVITTTFAPCFATVMAMGKELGARRTLMMMVAIGISALVVSGSLRWILITIR